MGMLLDHLMFLDPGMDYGTPLPIDYSPVLVAASYLIAVLGSYAALMIGDHLRTIDGWPKRCWLVIGALAMGLSVWTMHFIAMLAARLPVPVAYDALTTALSMVPAAIAGGICLAVVARHDAGARRVVPAGVTMGLGIGVMHYTGMAAMRLNADMLYEPARFGLSVVVAGVLAIAALYVMFAAKAVREGGHPLVSVASAMVMGLAIAMMHYTGMWAVFFFPAGPGAAAPAGIDGTSLASALGISATCLIGLVITAAAVNRRLHMASHEARTNRLQLLAAVENITEGFILFDKSRDVVVWNHVFEGMQPHLEGMLRPGMSYSQVFPEHAERQAETTAAGGPGNYRYRASYGEHFLPDGRWIHAKEAETESGNLAVLWVDVTPLMQAEAALRKSEAKYRTIVDTAHEGVCTVDAGNTITYANRRMADMLGRAPGEMEGRALDEFIDEAWQAEAQSKMEQRRAGLKDQYDFPFLHRDGSEVWTSIAAAPTTDDQGFSGALLMVSDITERRQLEKQLQQSQKMEAVGQLTGGVAHEFNNLLTAILGNLQLVQESVRGDAALHTAIKEALDAGFRGAELIKRLMAFSQKQLLAPKIVNVNEIVGTIDALLQGALGENIAISTRLDGDLWLTAVDSSQLENALLNLAVNARDAMPRGGTLTIETSNAVLDEDYALEHAEVEAGEYVLLRVSDTGSGISEEIRANVFEPFFSTKEVGQGSGLGLSMVYGFVKQSNGHINVYSEKERGTSFKIYLPRSRSAETGLTMRPGPSAVPTGNEKILLVEDDAAIRRAGARILKALGYEVLEAGTGAEALAVLEDQDGVDLLFTDVVMPGGMTGADLARHARRYNARLKVLYTSGYTDTAVFSDGVLADGDVFLNKPYRRDELAEKVRQVLEQAVTG